MNEERDKTEEGAGLAAGESKERANAPESEAKGPEREIPTGQGYRESSDSNLVIALLIAVLVLAAVSVALIAVVLARDKRTAPEPVPFRCDERLHMEPGERMKGLREELGKIGKEFGIRRISGEVTALEGEILTVRTAEKEVRVRLTESTRYGTIRRPRFRLEKEMPSMEKGDMVVVLARQSDGELEAVIVRVER